MGCETPTTSDCEPVGVDVTWESYKLEAYTQKFAETIFDFEEKVQVKQQARELTT